MMQNAIVIAIVIAIVAILLVPAAWWVSHTRLVGARNDVAGGWADVDAELERRHTLVPLLVHVVEEAADHERELLTDLTARHQAAMAAPHSANTANSLEPPLADAVRQVIALRERYPSLNSQQNFLELQHDLAMIEDRIAAARRYYNSRVEHLNRRVEAFPSAIVARRHGFEQAEFFDR